jgi:hypothetical protein
MNSSRKDSTILGATLAATFFCGASAAYAQTDADRLLDQGAAAFEAGDYGAALAAFEASYAADPAPELLLNIGMCQRLVGRQAEAVNSLRRFALSLGTDVSAEERTSIEQQIDEMLPALGQIVIAVSQAGARLFVDGRPVGLAPLGWAVAVEPGEHRVEARADGFEPAEQSVRVVAGQIASASLTLERAASTEGGPSGPPTLATAEDGDGLGWWFWGSTIATGALGLTMAVTGGLTLKYREDYLDSGLSDTGARDTGLALRTTTDVFLGLACAAAVSAILAVLFEEPEEDQDDGPASGAAGIAGPMGLVIVW